MDTAQTVASLPVTPTAMPSASASTATPQRSQPSTFAPIELSPELFAFLTSARYQQSEVAIKKSFSLTDEQLLIISDLDRLVMSGQLNLEAYLVALEDELGASTKLTDAQRDQLYAQLLADRFVPLGDRLSPTAMEIARSEQLTLPKTAYYQIYSKPLSYSGAVNEVAAMAGFSLVGGPTRERMRELFMGKAKGTRSDAEVRETLMRSQDVNGLGFDAPSADAALRAMTDVLSRTNVLSEDEYAAWLADEAHRKNVGTGSPRSAGSEDDEEIAKIQAKMQVPVPTTQLEKAIATTYDRLTYHTDDEYLAKRLRNVISSRLRDVRGAVELKQLLMRDGKVGGLGLPAADADAVTKQIEAAYAEFHEGIATEERSKIDAELMAQKRKVEERRQRETEEHAKWFEEKIRARKATESSQAQAFGNLRQAATMVGPTSPIHLKEQKREEERFGTLVTVQNPGAKASAPAASPMRPPSSPVPPSPAPASVKVSPATVQLAQTAAQSRPKMDGVSYAGPQLVGLVGELKSISIAEFRRISKRPEDAAKKIQQKIETLSQESFEKRIEGIRAFQSSPLQGMYMALVGESFRTGKPVAALADEVRRAKGDGLSSEEIGAIISLNGALHF